MTVNTISRRSDRDGRTMKVKDTLRKADNEANGGAVICTTQYSAGYGFAHEGKCKKP